VLNVSVTVGAPTALQRVTTGGMVRLEDEELLYLRASRHPCLMAEVKRTRPGNPELIR
jgi:hypothetical protein